MAPRTSQLQIRVSPEQKATLKRLAAHAGLSVSAYVLAQSIPSEGRALESAIADLRAGTPGAVPVLRRQVEAIPPQELGDRLGSVDVSDLGALAQNQFAALVEEVAREAGAEPPRWTATIPALDAPHFRWPLRSLRPYQLRSSPIVLKRRNIFDPDPSGVGEPSTRVTPDAAELPRALRQMQGLLTDLQIDLEFYFVSGALLHQAFQAQPRSVRPQGMFASDAPLREAFSSVAKAEGWSGIWPEAALRECVRSRAPGQGYLDAPRLKVFTPPLGYALAMKTGGATLAGPGWAEDLSFLLRALNLTTPDAAMTVITRYLAERQLPGDTRERLGRALGR